MLNGHCNVYTGCNSVTVNVIASLNLVVSNAAGASSSVVESGKNDDGYQFHVSSQQAYRMWWNATAARVDPTKFTIHYPESLTASDWVFIQGREQVYYDHVNVRNQATGITLTPLIQLPPVNGSAPHGSSYYNTAASRDAVDGVYDYVFSVLTSNTTSNTAFAPDLAIQVRLCPESGCPQPPSAPPDFRGRLFWSANSTWGSKGIPTDGTDVTVPYGWDLVLDVSSARLGRLIVEGNLTFSELADVNLTAAYIVVRYNGVFRVGGNGGLSNQLNTTVVNYPPPPPPPFPPSYNGSCWTYPNATLGTYLNATNVTLPSLTGAWYSRRTYISLTGNPSSAQWALTNDLVLGSKMLAAISGGQIIMSGRPTVSRWTRLGATAYAGNQTIVLRTAVDWQVGDVIGITSTSWNHYNRESFTITAINYPNATEIALFAAAQLAIQQQAQAAALAAFYNCTTSYISGTSPSVANFTQCNATTMCNIQDPVSGCWSAGITNFVSLTSNSSYYLNDTDGTFFACNGTAGYPCSSACAAPVFNLTLPVIANVSAPGTVITLSGPLVYSHLCRPQLVQGIFIDYCAEVALLSSNVVVRADDGETSYAGTTDTGKFGVSLQAGYKTAGYMAGSVKATNVQIAYGGKYGQGYAAVSWYNTYEGGVLSYLRNCSLTNVMYGGISIDYSQGVELSGNVVWESLDTNGVRITDTANFLVNNLVTGTAKISKNKSEFDRAYPASFLVEAGGNVVQNNVAAGSDRLGFQVVGDPCLYTASVNNSYPYTYNGLPLIYNNTAHSSLIGLMLRDTDQLVGLVDTTLGGRVAACTQLTGFVGWKNWDFAVLAAVRGMSTNARFDTVAFVETKHTGLRALQVRGSLTTEANVTVVNSVFVGQTASSSCRDCPTGTEAGCAPNLSRFSFSATGIAIGLESPSFGISFTSGPEHKPWDELMGYQLVRGQVFVSNVSFVNYTGTDSCGIANTGYRNHQDPDASYPHYFSLISTVAVATGALLNIQGPNPGWRNPVRCGVDTYFSASTNQLLPLNCAGASHTLLYDVDGTLTGTGIATALQGASPSPRLAFDQSSGLFSGTCSNYGGQMFTTNGAAYYEKSCLQSAVNPQFFVIESMDPDTETRDFGPLFLTSNGMVDVLTPQLDDGWCFSYTCHKRLSTFYSTVNMGSSYFLNFTGTPPSNLRFWLPYASAQTEILLGIQFYVSSQPYVWSIGQGHISASTSIPILGTGAQHGTYYFDQSANVVWVIIRGGLGGVPNLQVRLQPIIQVSMVLAETVTQFFASNNFAANVASVLGISLDRIKVATVVSGRRRALLASTVAVSFQILPAASTLNAGLTSYAVNTAAPMVDYTTFNTIKNDPVAQAFELTFIANLAAQDANTTATARTFTRLIGGVIASSSAYNSTDNTTYISLTDLSASLSALVTALNNSITSGAMAQALGVQILSVSISISGAPGSSDGSGTSGSISLTVPVPAPPPPPSPYSGVSVSLPIVTWTVRFGSALLSDAVYPTFQANYSSLITAGAGSQVIQYAGAPGYIISASAGSVIYSSETDFQPGAISVATSFAAALTSATTFFAANPYFVAYAGNITFLVLPTVSIATRVISASYLSPPPPPASTSSQQQGLIGTYLLVVEIVPPVVVGLALIALLVWFLVRRRRRMESPTVDPDFYPARDIKVVEEPQHMAMPGVTPATPPTTAIPEIYYPPAEAYPAFSSAPSSSGIGGIRPPPRLPPIGDSALRTPPPPLRSYTQAVPPPPAALERKYTLDL